MSNKTTVGLLFGGKSPEHNISILSAKNIFSAIDKDRFDVILIYINRAGVWHFCKDGMLLENGDDPKTVSYIGEKTQVSLSQNANDRQLIDATSGEVIAKIDVLYPVLHGNFGEDGSIQGFAKLANIACVGCGILGSSVGMDKDIVKRILRDAGIGVADFVTLRKAYNEDMNYEEVSAKLGKELFVKPANLGSSVGVSFVADENAYNQAVEVGFSYDTKVLVEEKVTGREIECAVMGNEIIEASVIGEILPKSAWYSFENKYVDEDGAKLAIPAQLTPAQAEKARNTAIETYRLLECRGLTRVDMFLLADDHIIVNEVNTLPGFTKVSMYPKMWEAAGLPYQQLVTKLIELAIEEHQKMNALMLI